ncbi:flagellar hook protein FlgE [Anaerobiospirillum succiniciproducens]|uniref:flagellar hook protein FlgE n=1 Tax=Anaerobiospirillum succiniciproducens TaxID=13335 RepID=UPI0023578B3E|nr:flagellar hook protein FlgE [Anaerobiospirillum succiniciproducens]MCI6862749.1 flagellar hook protein FlgE [Anaerobiospirillum succiniciproducens]
MFGISVSGIKNSQKHIDVTSNNISNTNSYGFKKSRAEFADVYANSVFTNSKTTSGMGVQNTVVSQQFVQGALSGDTGNPLDMAIQGNGFFVLEGPGSDAQTFTRNGAFQINKEGFVVTAMGDYLQGWDVNPDGTTTSLDLSNTHNIRLPADTGAPQMSTNISIGVNLPADKDNIKPNFPDAADPWTGAAWNNPKPTNPEYGIKRNPTTGALDQNGKLTQYFTDFDPKNASTYTASTSQTIHDSLGRAHTLTYYMLKMGPESKDSNNNVWTVIPFVDGNPVDIATQGTGNNAEYPTAITVPGSSKSSVAGANFFGFKCTFLPNGEMKDTVPGKLELVNPNNTNPTATVANSLREVLFGKPGGAAGGTGNTVFDNTFEYSGANNTGKKPIFEGNDGSLHTALGQGIDPLQKLNIQFSASQYGSSNFSVSQAPTNDGYATGILIGMSVDENGIIQCEYSNGQVKNIAKVAMADFANQQGLTKIGDTQWKQSNASGEAIAKEANSGSAGSIKGSNLELSNVDLTNELVELITAQRNYQANAQSLQTQNTVMDSILNIR